jgi:cytidylate kinase
MSPPSNSRPLLTLSATYGAGGSVVGTMVADLLGLPFCDRLVSPEVAHLRLAADDAPSCGESANPAECQAVPGAGFFGRLVPVMSLGTAQVPPAAFGDRDAIRRLSETEIDEAVGSGGGVVLGRAGAVVFALEPTAYHVRLDGPPERRLAQGAVIEEIDEVDAIERMVETDRVRTQFTRRLYGADAADPSHYHLVVDTTALPIEYVVELVAQAALAFWARLGAVDHLPSLRT